MSVPKWGDELHRLEQGGFAFDSISLRGREETTSAIRGVVGGLLTGAFNHGQYNVLIASGHVRSGKTRIGQAGFKIVTAIAPASNALYVPVNLGNGHGFDVSFDPHVTPSEALGARMAILGQRLSRL
jgi:hypothetical protein